MAKLTLQRANLLIELLGELADPVNQPYDRAWGERLTTAISNVAKLTAIEAVTLRREAGGLEVLLAQRPTTPEEPYPGQWHSPGTLVYVNDPAEPDPQLARLTRREIQPAKYAEVVFAGHCQAHTPPRGPIRQEVYVARIEGGEPGKGKFFPVNALPVPFHEQHHQIIAIAVKKAEELSW